MQQILNDIKSSSNSLSIDKTLLDESHSNSTELNSSFSKIEQTAVTNVISSLNYSELFYDMQAKHFGADKVRTIFIGKIFTKIHIFVKGAPSVCIICHKSDHVKSDCPELSVPNIIDLPIISQEWFNIISRICRQISGI